MSIISGLSIVILFIWLYLSIYGDLVFFLIILFALIIQLLLFIKPVRLYDRAMDQIVPAGFLAALPPYLVFMFSNSEPDNSLLMQSSILFLLLFNSIGIKNLRRVYTDPQMNKRTISVLMGANKFKNLLTGTYLLVYPLTFFTMLISENIFALVPLFSIPVAVSILVKTYRSTGKQLKPIYQLSIFHYFYHAFLIILGILLEKSM